MTARSAFRLTRRVSCRLPSQPGYFASATSRRWDGARSARPSASPARERSGSPPAVLGGLECGNTRRTPGAAAAAAKASGSEPGCRRGHRWPSCSFSASSFWVPGFVWRRKTPRGASQGAATRSHSPEGTGRARGRHSGDPMTAAISAPSPVHSSPVVCVFDAGARVGETRSLRLRRAGAAGEQPAPAASALA